MSDGRLCPALELLGSDLERAMRRAEDAPGTRSAVTRGSHGWRRLAVAATLCAALSTAAVLGLSAHRAAVSAAAVLDSAARAALAAPSLMPRDDQYFYVRSEGTNLQEACCEHGRSAVALVTTERQLWTSVSRSGLLRESVLSVRYPTASDRRLMAQAGAPTPGPESFPAIDPTGGYFIGGERLTTGQLLGLTVNPQRLYLMLRGPLGAPRLRWREKEVFTEVGDALREAPAPPALRSALYRVLALVPNIRIVPGVRDASGRIGTAVTLAWTGVDLEYIFDPGNAEIIGERQVLLRPAQEHLDLRPGALLENVVYLARAVTGALPRSAAGRGSNPPRVARGARARGRSAR